MEAKKNKQVQKQLLAWYRLNARKLPWREIDDPYLIWISEVMLQQTQVNTVIPYFQQWIAQFPTINSVAYSSEDDILRAWEGLGYYSRARNIKKAAGIILKEYNGYFPQTMKDLKELPGIGKYIAGAIASIAFGQDEPALEANGIRVISRLYDFHGLVNRAKNKRILRKYLQELLPPGKAGFFNQAIMDLGSLICILGNPKCSTCPIQKECLALARGTQFDIPHTQRRTVKPHYDVVAAVIQENDRVLIGKRPAKGLLGGLWEYPGGKVENSESHAEALIRELHEELGIAVELTRAFGVYRHAYTHFSVTVFPYFVKIIEGKPEALEADRIEWVDLCDLYRYPMGKVDRNISNDLLPKET